MRSLVPLVAVAALAATGAAAQELGYSGSVHMSSGRYIFTETTRTFSIHNGLDFRSGRLRLSAGLPVVIHNSTAVTLVGGRLVPTGGPDHAAVRQREPGRDVPMGGGRHGRTQGGAAGFDAWTPGLAAAEAVAPDTVLAPGDYETHLGDPSFGATLTLVEGSGALRAVDLSGWAKAPLADLESGVGTGEWDVGAGASVTLGAGRLLMFGDVGYWRYGDLPDLELQDGFTYGAGVGTPVGERGSLMLSFSAAETLIEAVDAWADLSLLGGYRLGERTTLSAGVGVGLTEAGADASAFVGWRVGLGAPSRREVP